MARGRRRRAYRRRLPRVLLSLVGSLAIVGVFAAVYVVSRDVDRRDAKQAATLAQLERGQVADRASRSGDRGEAADDSDPAAVQYFKDRWGIDDASNRRVKNISFAGSYLRIYTDLPESANNSSEAITLCERGRDFLTTQRGVTKPVIFVQASFGENGNPVLANILGPDDTDCKVTHPEPQG